MSVSSTCAPSVAKRWAIEAPKPDALPGLVGGELSGRMGGEGRGGVVEVGAGGVRFEGVEDGTNR